VYKAHDLEFHSSLDWQPVVEGSTFTVDTKGLWFEYRLVFFQSPSGKILYRLMGGDVLQLGR